ncbi:IS200/IS605 family transposase [Oligosphaera ethanolica]|uniref:REP element-mobilizing transposase RayT n=1 Tax=Oligosphaera ethanolica TaxID=760260 RepID=A0AAE3VK16_9BACT|nr:IS200/IS605 family transposase [Oligosphaera ethanolica]MDQ0291873.1 REP element-mobilizing transposase RayT [Oligosphaera ethanolica]
MPQSLSNILLHLIFSTKDRQPWLVNDLRCKAHALLAGTVRQRDCEAYRVGGTEDHVHMAILLARTIAVADLVQDIKISSSRWLKRQDPSLKVFAWQNGYGIFSIGVSQKEVLQHYIDGQMEHHRTHTFQDEYRAFLRKHGIKYDEKYVWD